MEKLTQLNTQVDLLIAALRSAQNEATHLRKDLAASRTAGEEKDARIRTLEQSGEEKDLQVLSLEEDIAKKNAQVDELLARIEKVLAPLSPPTGPNP